VIKLSNSEILIESVSREIEIIIKRIFAIKKSFFLTSNYELRKRLSNEYYFLCSRFIDFKYKVVLFNEQSRENISYSSILKEKYIRFEKFIYKNNHLFFV
tara:strand:+ start:617 stop:916 length:300 start_codon:yes stop_codon:yes gene_type:complete